VQTTVLRDSNETGSDACLRAFIACERNVAGRSEIVTGDRSETLHLVISGMAVRFRMLKHGTRQITALILPGELCDLWDHVGGRDAGKIETVTPCTIAEIPREALFDQGAMRPEWTEFVLRALAREADIATEWIVSLGQRSAFEAAAHLFCEVWERMQKVGLADGTSFPLGLTQVDLADVLGMTSVHVNRTLRDLRTAGLIKVRGKVATVLDPAGLRAAADFGPAYLNRHETTSSRLSRR
jgi:CRP-like cAMP-binding protein